MASATRTTPTRRAQGRRPQAAWEGAVSWAMISDDLVRQVVGLATCGERTSFRLEG